MLDEAVASLKKKRRNRFVRDRGISQIWVSLLCWAWYCFAWNEFGSLLRHSGQPFTLLRNVVEQRLDASLSADYFGGNLVRSVLLGEKNR